MLRRERRASPFDNLTRDVNVRTLLKNPFPGTLGALQKKFVASVAFLSVFTPATVSGND